MYFIGSPVITSATLKLHRGINYNITPSTTLGLITDFVINAYNNSKSNVFVNEVRLNSKKIDLQTSPFLHHTGNVCVLKVIVLMVFPSPALIDIVSGGKLEFWMTSKQPQVFE